MQQALRGDPAVPAVLQRGRQAGPAVHQQLRHHQRARRAGAHAGRRPGAAVRQARLLDAHLVRHRPADQPQPRAVRHRRRRSSSRTCRRRSAASARGRSASDQQFQLNVQTQGRLTTPEQFGNIVLRANPDGSVLRIRDVARVELGAQNMDTESRAQRPARRSAIGALSRARRQCGADLGARRRRARRAARRASPRACKARVVYDSSTVFVTDTIHEVLKTLAEAFVLVVHRRLPVPRQHPRHDHPDRRRAGQPDRHLRRPAGRRLLGQHRLAARAGAGDRHRRRRRDRGGRERRARDGGAARTCTPHEATQEGDAADHRADHRHHAWCCCRCSCRSPSSPASRASCSASSR